MGKKLIAIITTIILIFSASLTSAYIYEPPYLEIDGGRAKQNMPEIFSPDTVPGELVGTADFNDGNLFSDTLTSDYNNTGAVLTEDGTIQIKKSEVTENDYSFKLRYQPTETLVSGEAYVFTCRMKGGNVKTSAPKSILEVYNGTKWMTCSGSKIMLGTSDWLTMTQILFVPQNATHFILQVNLPKTTTGTVYFDDFKLYKVALDPLETVLRTPNYKGLIFGDGYCNIDLDVLITPVRKYYELDEMKLIVQLVDGNDNVISKSECDKLSEKMNFVFSADGLDEGDYYVQSILIDSLSGEILSKKENTIRKRSEDYRPGIYVDKNGHYVKNNKKTLVNRIYQHSAYKTPNSEAAQAALDMGIDNISNYGLWWAVENRDEDTLNFLRENGLTMHICLGTYWFSDRKGNEGTKMIGQQSDILPMFNQIAKDYKDDPAFGGYYVFDEPDTTLVDEEIRWNNEILAEADIDHPTFGVADKGYDEYGLYVKMTDILGIDPYPITGKTDDNGDFTHNIAKVGSDMRKIKQNFPNRPVYLVMQGFHYSSRGDLRSPTYDELRNMAWQAICEGAAGFDWYAYPDMTIDTTKTLEEWKNEVTTLLAEVKDYKNVIFSDEPAPLYNVVGGGDWLNLSVKRYNGKTYIFAVNNTYANQSADIKINGTENISLSFTPLEVKLLEVEQNDFLSPEAELINMGFCNGENVFMTSDGDNKTIYVPAENGVINYTAKISDNASLYIGGVKIPSKGKITVRNLEEFTLKVVAEDGETTFCQTYRVVKEQREREGEYV